jgi:DNA-binding PadR family transcriptional regulator
VASKPTTTSFGILGLLGVQPWTAYELVAQSKRSLHWFWPRSEAHLYAELKRLVERGHAEAEVVDGRRRQRTRYTITQQGRAALDDWLGTEPAAPSLEFEALLRMILADQGSLDDLRASIAATTLQAREMRATGIALSTDLLTTGGPFPERLHLTERAITFYAEFVLLVLRWCDETLSEVETWPDTRDVGLTPKARERLERVTKMPDH